MCLHNYVFPVVHGIIVPSYVIKVICANFKNSPVSSLLLLMNLMEYNLFLVFIHSVIICVTSVWKARVGAQLLFLECIQGLILPKLFFSLYVQVLQNYFL